MKYPTKHRRQPKREAAVAELTTMALRLGPGAQLPLFMDLCRQLNVSKMTLDSALAELEQREIIRRAPGVGIFVSATVRRTLVIAYAASLLEESGSLFWSLLIESLKNRIQKADFEYSLRPVYDHENLDDVASQLISSYKEQAFQGVITFNFSVEVSDPLSQHKIPLVAFVGYADWAVSLDNDYLISAGIWQLARRNCQRIGLWEAISKSEVNDASTVAIDDHRRSLQQSLDANNLELDPALSTAIVAQDDFELSQKAYKMAKKVFSESTRPDGLLIMSDLITAGVMQALDEIGIEVGRDVHIVSSANRGSPVLQSHHNRIILMEFDSNHISAKIMELIQEQLDASDSVGENRAVRPVPRVPNF